MVNEFENFGGNLLAATLAYIIMSGILAIIFGVPAFQSALSEGTFGSQVANAWIVIGATLGIADLAVFLNFLSEMADGF